MLEEERSRKMGMRAMRRVATLMIVLAAGPGIGLCEEPGATLLADHYKESSGPRPLAAADGAIIGLEVPAGGLTSEGALSLYVRNRSGERSVICVQVTSVDGFYEAINEYALPGGTPGAYIRIPVNASQPLGTSRPEIYRAATVRSLAIRASEGLCRNENPRLLPVIVGRPPEHGTSVQLTVAARSGGDPAEISFLDKRAPIHCESFNESFKPGELHSGFDSLCTGSLPDRPGEVAFQLTSYSYGEPRKEALQHLLL
jgi:hypothetical protein